MVAANKVTLADIGFWLFLLCVTLLPIGFGGNRPIPFGIAQAGLALTSLLLILGRNSWTPAKLFPRLRVMLCLLATVVAWAWVQTQTFVPASWSHPLWQEASGVLNQPLHGTIAISPESSIGGLTRMVTYIVVGLIAYLTSQDPKRARRVIHTLWVTGTLICIYGLIEYISGGHKILWFKKWAYEEDLTATFVNRNHFAVYAGMVMTCGASLLAQSWRDGVSSQKPTSRAEAIRYWLGHQGAMYSFSLALILICIILSHSRAGLMLSLGGIGGYFFFYQLYRRNWARALMTLLVAFIILATSLGIAKQYSDRFAGLFTDYSSTDRMKVYGLTLEAIRDNPWLGYGLDGFQPVFRIYERGMIMEFTHAHSDVLESLLDLGVPGGLMLWTALLILASGLARGIARRRRNGMYACLGLAACLIVIGHSFVDFSMQIPGVMFPWAMLVGTGLAQSWRQQEKEPAHELM